MTSRGEGRGVAVANWATLFTNSLVGTGVTFAALPVASAYGLQDAWTSVAIGNAVGSFAAVGVGLGWAVTGPALVATGTDGERLKIYQASIRSRLAAALLAVPAAFAVGVWLGGALAAGLAAIATALGGLSAVWFLIGSSKIRLMFWSDTVPRILASSLGLCAISQWGLVGFTSCLILGGVVAPIISHSALMKIAKAKTAVSESLWTTVKRQRHAFLTAATTALYVAAPLPIVAHTYPTDATVFAAGQSAVALIVTLTRPVLQHFQSRAGEMHTLSPAGYVHRTLRRGAVGGTVTAVIMFTCCWAFLPLLSRSAARTSLLDDLLLAVMAGSIFTSQIVGLACLVALGASRAVALSTLTGAAIGFLGILIASPTFGASGAWLALTCAEVSVVAYQLAALPTAIRTYPDRLRNRT